MIRSGLVVQNRIGFEGFPSQRNSHPRDETIRPYVYGQDLPILEKSNYATPKFDPRTNFEVTTFAQTQYENIFDQSLTPTEKFYLSSMIQKIQRGGTGIGGGQIFGGRPNGIGQQIPGTMPGINQPQPSPPATGTDGQPIAQPPMQPPNTGGLYPNVDTGLTPDQMNDQYVPNLENEIEAEQIFQDTFQEDFEPIAPNIEPQIIGLDTGSINPTNVVVAMARRIANGASLDFIGTAMQGILPRNVADYGISVIRAMEDANTRGTRNFQDYVVHPIARGVGTVARRGVNHVVRGAGLTAQQLYDGYVNPDRIEDIVEGMQDAAGQQVLNVGVKTLLIAILHFAATLIASRNMQTAARRYIRGNGGALRNVPRVNYQGM